MSELAEVINNIAEDGNCGEMDSSPISTSSINRTRFLLKVQNGCDHWCSYCIVPAARGPERSVPLDAVLREVASLKASGVNEVVLTGVQLGAWGKDLKGKPTLAFLTEKVADLISPGRVRLSSVEPWSVDEALIEVVAGHGRVCPHLHVPLQSGDDGILREMNRGYTGRQWLEIVNRALEKIEDLALGTDVLCGFPGESESAFEKTICVLRDAAIAYVHAFPFSKRPGTKASTMKVFPGRETARKRVMKIRDLGDKFRIDFQHSQYGKIRQVVVEEKSERAYTGITDNFLKVELKGDCFKKGELVNAVLEKRAGGGTAALAIALNTVGNPINYRSCE